MSDLRKFINILNESYTEASATPLNEAVEGETLGVIAKKHLKIKSLLAKGDVNHDVSISSLKKAMEEAYDAGYGAGTKKKEKETKKTNESLSEAVEGETISVIAKKHLGVKSLQAKGMVPEERAISDYRKALQMAYDAGYGAGTKKKEKEDKTLSEGVEGETLTSIAKKHLKIPTLELRNSDSKDFHNLGVVQIKAALEAAYDAGYGAGINKKEKEDKKK